MVVAAHPDNIEFVMAGKLIPLGDFGASCTMIYRLVIINAVDVSTMVEILVSSDLPFSQ